jgi:hypothetical protein
MDLTRALAELHEERDCIDGAIFDVLTPGYRGTQTPRPATKVDGRGPTET